MGKIHWTQLVLSIFACELAGIIGSAFTFPEITTWYAGLTKPWFNPPNWVFGPVWTLLYALMGIALYIVWTKKAEKKGNDMAYTAFGAQLALNTIWSIVFFGMHQLFGALIVIGLMWITILATIVLFRRIDSNAALLLAPYLLWVSFASALNFAVWQLNG
jgi:tryptophan-rich sensory protein